MFLNVCLVKIKLFSCTKNYLPIVLRHCGYVFVELYIICSLIILDNTVVGEMSQ